MKCSAKAVRRRPGKHPHHALTPFIPKLRPSVALLDLVKRGPITIQSMVSMTSFQPRLAVRPPSLGIVVFKSKGFTLLEVMVVVAILAVLAALAAPSFTPLIERWRVREVSENMQSTLYFARSEAIKRGGGVTIQNQCLNNVNTWTSGWQVCGGTTVLQAIATPTKVTMSVAGDTGGVITLDRWGQFGSALSFNFYPATTSTAHAAANTICVSPSGQIKRLNEGSASCS